MAIKEVFYTEEFEKIRNKEENLSLYRTWAFLKNNNILILERYTSVGSYGFCGWTDLILRKDNQEVYRLKSLNNELEKMEEYFFSKLERKYNGNKISFIEFFTNTIDSNYNYDSQGAIDLKLDFSIQELYSLKLEQILKEDSPLLPQMVSLDKQLYHWDF